MGNNKKEGKIKCGEGVFAFVNRLPREEIIFTGEPMTAAEFKKLSKEIVKKDPIAKDCLKTIYKFLYEKV